MLSSHSTNCHRSNASSTLALPDNAGLQPSLCSILKKKPDAENACTPEGPRRLRNASRPQAAGAWPPHPAYSTRRQMINMLLFGKSRRAYLPRLKASSSRRIAAASACRRQGRFSTALAMMSHSTLISSWIQRKRNTNNTCNQPA